MSLTSLSFTTLKILKATAYETPPTTTYRGSICGPGYAYSTNLTTRNIEMAAAPLFHIAPKSNLIGIRLRRTTTVKTNDINKAVPLITAIPTTPKDGNNTGNMTKLPTIEATLIIKTVGVMS